MTPLGLFGSLTWSNRQRNNQDEHVRIVLSARALERVTVGPRPTRVCACVRACPCVRAESVHREAHTIVRYTMSVRNR